MAAIGSLLTGLAALWSISEASDIASRDQLRQNMQLYLNTYMHVQDQFGAAAIGDVKVYDQLSAEGKANIQIVDGLLVSVVDAMYAANDPRVDTWKGFIRTIPGPLASGYPLWVYATRAETQAAIKAAQEAIRSSPDPVK